MEEYKAYDPKGLIQEVKGEGLELAEESAKAFIKGFMAWLKKSADKSENPYDDVAAFVYPKIESFALGHAENINKADNV